MKNYWLIKSEKKKAVRAINLQLATFCGKYCKYNLVEEMRKVVLAYFKQNPQHLKLFSQDGRFEYRFHVEEKGGVILQVLFEEKT